MLDKCPLFSNLPRDDIAKIIPIAPLRRFREKKIIDIKGKEISILNKLLLQKILSGEKC